MQGARSARYRDTRRPGRAGFLRLVGQLEARAAAASGRARSVALRDLAAVRLLYDLALRRNEVVSLDVAHLDLEAGRVLVLGKGRGEREALTLPDKTRAVLAAWLAERGAAPGLLFVNFDPAGKGSAGGRRLTATSLYRVVRDAGDAAGVRASPRIAARRDHRRARADGRRRARRAPLLPPQGRAHAARLRRQPRRRRRRARAARGGRYVRRVTATGGAGVDAPSPATGEPRGSPGRRCRPG